MHIETLKTFCDLVDSGSFSQAARMNFITQSAVSQQLQALEQRFGLELLDHSIRRRVVLTPAGRNLLEAAREIIQIYAGLEDRLRAGDKSIAGEIRIATVYSVGLHELPPFLKSFLREHPQVHVHLAYHRTNLVYEACLDNSIDFGIVALPQHRQNLEILPLKGDNLVLVCSPEHPLARRKRISVKRLAGADFISFERDIPTRKQIDRILRENETAVQIVMEFDNVETIKRSVEAGIGIAILPDAVVTNEVRNGQLCRLDFTEGPFHRPVGIIYRKGKSFTQAARALMDLLTKSEEA